MPALIKGATKQWLIEHKYTGLGHRRTECTCSVHDDKSFMRCVYHSDMPGPFPHECCAWRDPHDSKRRRKP